MSQPPRLQASSPIPNRQRNPRARGVIRSSVLALCAGFELAEPNASSACPVPFDLEDSIFLEVAPGTNAEVQIGGITQAGDAPSCTAWVSVPLSVFPSTRLATRPADVARSLRDAVEKMGAKECTITVFLQNDTHEEIAEHELCLEETFRFGACRVWSSARESFCWEPALELGIEAEPVADPEADPSLPSDEELVSIE